jgi:hypothetical protein
MKLLQQAKFAAGPIGYYEPSESEGWRPHRTGSLIQPALIELDGIQFQSAVPKSAADAAKINAVVLTMVEAR